MAGSINLSPAGLFTEFLWSLVNNCLNNSYFTPIISAYFF